MNLKPLSPGPSARELVTRAQHTLGLTHEKFGAAIGVSKRTATRIAANRASVSMQQVAVLAGLVHPIDPQLAADLATSAGESLESLGLVPSSRVATAHLVDSVVCAAADALGVPPASVRGAVHAAFRRAREMRLGMEEVEGVLAAGVVAEKAAAKPKA